MSENQSLPRVGQTAKLDCKKGPGKGLWVDVRVLEQNSFFGRVILTVTPVAGSGTAKVNEDSLKGFAWPKEQT